MYQTVIILDFGGQYKELIARRVRELGVYSEIWPCDTPLEKIRAANPIGVIFTGGPDNVYAPDAPACDRGVFELGVPVLGICYGMQFMCHSLGGQVSPCDKSEYGVVDTRLTGESRFFGDLDKAQRVLMSHTDYVSAAPEGFIVTAQTSLCPAAAMECPQRNLYAVQFHPEVENTVNGKPMLRRFLYEICGATGDYNMNDYLEREMEAYAPRWATSACCWACPAAWIPPSARRCSPAPSPAASPASTLITASCAKTKPRKCAPRLPAARWICASLTPANSF